MGDRFIGREVGNYRISGKLGEGGMGAVYAAEHPELGRRVAIKVIRPELGHDAEVVARFLREGRAANQVRHPGLVDVLDLGRLADGTLYLVMELLDGESLRRRLERRGPLAIGDALAILAECVAALRVLHRAGIVHRDLKPDNIFLAGDGAGQERVKILDFGMVKLLERPDVVHSATGAILGTPLYMAPEQCEGSKHIDARADVYAMGCVLHQMLAGQPPFRPENAAKALLMHLSMPPPPLRSQRPDVPAALEAAVLRALAKRPEDRFATIDELAVAAGVTLPPERARAATPTPPSPAEPALDPGLATTRGRASGELHAPRRPPRRRTAAIAVAGLGLLAVAGVVVAFTMNEPDDPVATDPETAVPGRPAASEPRAPEPGPAAKAASVDPLVDAWSPCLHGDAAACENQLHQVRAGSPLPDLGDQCAGDRPCAVVRAWQTRDTAAARAACQAGVPTGCLVLGHQTVSPAEADAYFRRGAKLLDPVKHRSAGYLLGLMTAFGIGGKRDGARARQQLSEACSAMDQASCRVLRCLDPLAGADPRMKALDRCQRDGLIDDLMIEIAKNGLVNEVTGKGPK